MFLFRRFLFYVYGSFSSAVRTLDGSSAIRTPNGSSVIRTPDGRWAEDCYDQR